MLPALLLVIAVLLATALVVACVPSLLAAGVGTQSVELPALALLLAVLVLIALAVVLLVATPVATLRLSPLVL